MKDSGIDWIGKIPDEWEINKFDSLYTMRNTKVSDKNYPPLSVTMKGIVPQLATAAKSDDGDNRKLVKKGDFVINSRSDRRGSSGISNYDGSVSLINTILTPRGKMNPDYYNWLFHTVQFEDEFYKWGHGIVDDLWTTRWQDMKNISVLVPPEEAQEKIANFLDKKCAQIDSIIEESKKSIEEYKSWKQSVIFEAVTGKNLSCKKKDSGIEWLDEIPEEWEVRALKTIFRIFSGTTPKSDIIEYWDGDVNWVTPADFKTEDVYVENGKRNISENGFSDCSLELIPINSLIFSKRAPIGKVCINRNEMCTNQGCLACVKKINLSIKFFYYLLSSLTEYFEVLGSGTTFKEISLTSFSDFKVLFPPISEQKSIAKFLDAKCAQIDSLISEKQSLIKDLAEYKKSLIFEAVTGKRRV